MLNYIEILNFDGKDENYKKELTGIIESVFYNISHVELVIEYPESFSYENSKTLLNINSNDIYEDLYSIGKIVNENISVSFYSYEALKKNIIRDSVLYKNQTKKIFDKYGFIETSNKIFDIVDFFQYCLRIYYLSKDVYLYLKELNKEHEKYKNISEINRNNYYNWNSINSDFDFFDSIYPNYLRIKCLYINNKSENIFVFSNIFQMALYYLKEKIYNKEEDNKKICPNCNNLFIPKRANQLYCSRQDGEKCYLERQRKRKNKSKSNKKCLL